MKLISQFFQSVKHAIRGIYCLLSERHFRSHLVVAILVVGFGIYFDLNRVEWGLITLTIAVVMTAEGINTAIERCVDLASPEWHLFAKDAKDIAAGAVLIASTCAAIIGFIIFFPKIVQ
jgi:undecaprenol kinase